MTHIYNVSGMTCGSCSASVKSALSSLPNVEEVTVNLNENKVTIKMSSHIELKTLQDALSDKYTISDTKNTNVFNSVSTKTEPEQNGLKQLFPLFLIIGYILVASILLNTSPFNTSSFMLDFMGLFYTVFSFFKLLDLRGFSESFRMYDPLAKAISTYGWVYPFVEVALGLMFLMRFQIEIALVVTLVILSITTVGVTKTLFNKESIQCACLGTVLKLPMTKATFIENSIMIVMAIIVLTKMIWI
jgi:cation transport ATPase